MFARDLCLHNADLALVIAVYLDSIDLLKLQQVSHFWESIVVRAFDVVVESEGYKYLAFKESKKFVTNKEKCSHIAYNRIKKQGGFLLFDSSFGSYALGSHFIVDGIDDVVEPQITEKPEVESGIGATAVVMDHQRKLYMIGGWMENHNRALSTVFHIDADDLEDEWELHSNINEPRCFSSASSTIQGDLLLLGGGNSPFQGATVHRSCLFKSSTSDTWDANVVQDMLSPRCGHSSVTLFDNKILTMGGYGGGRLYYTSSEMWDWEKQCWYALPNMHHARSGMACVLGPSGSIYVTGGSYDGTHGNTSLERFDPREGKWEILPAALNLPRGYISGAIGSQMKFYVSGGLHQGKLQSGLEYYDFRMGGNTRWQFVGGSTACYYGEAYTRLQETVDFPPEELMNISPEMRARYDMSIRNIMLGHTTRLQETAAAVVHMTTTTITTVPTTLFTASRPNVYVQAVEEEDAWTDVSDDADGDREVEVEEDVMLVDVEVPAIVERDGERQLITEDGEVLMRRWEVEEEPPVVAQQPSFLFLDEAFLRSGHQFVYIM